MTTSDQRIKSISTIEAPQQLLDAYPASEQVAELVSQTRSAIGNILHQRDSRLLVIVGPCSIHDPEAAIDYARRLLPLRTLYQDQLEIVMRVYFEKPRTTIGWKGLINDPDLNNTFNVDHGLTIARKLLLQLNELGMPAATEFLDAVTGQYFADLISWGAIGARTTESQVHRELASGLSCPVGFKNGTNGNVNIAVDAVLAAGNEHSFLSPTVQGQTALFRTRGNKDAHIILRGGKQPNYDAPSVQAACDELNSRGVKTGLMIDFSHANSNKNYLRQMHVGDAVAAQIKMSTPAITGVMIESHINAGNQAVAAKDQLEYGKSITDACLGFDDTTQLLSVLANAILSASRA